MIRIAIVDDEKIIREEITRLVKTQLADCLADAFESGEALLLAGKTYDIVFLDIRLNGKNGIDIAKTLQENAENTVLIFVSGAKDHVFQAFDVAAFHYLLKPIDPAKFGEVLTRAVREVEKRQKPKAEPLLIRTKNRSFPLQKGNILYVESRGKKAEVHTAGETIEIYASLNGLEAELGAGFYRSHRSYLVNMAYVSEYGHDSIFLTDGEQVYLAKEKYTEFVKTYMRYLKGGGISYA